GFRRSDVESRPEVAVEDEVAPLGARFGGIDGRGHPDVPAPECKAFGHDANQRGALVIQEEGLAYNIRVEPEPAEPHLITKNEDGRCAGLPVAGNNTA